MNRNGITANVPRLPECDFCKDEVHIPAQAHYDGKTDFGPWAYMCKHHFKLHGIGLGTGLGQRLIVQSK